MDNNTKNNITELVFILDKSGSMSGLENDTIGGYNSLLEKQKKEPGDAVVTTVLFDNNYKLLHDRLSIRDIAPITGRDYFVGGTTALLDAIGRTIHYIGNIQKNICTEKRADRVMFVIITDGMENSSREYNYEKVKFMIERQKTEYNWEFIFLGANIDAVATAAKFGISEDRSANYHADGDGTKLNYDTVCFAVSEIRASRPLDRSWKKNIDEDFKKRNKNRL
jgi:uncharacterized protein YegL